tara:strand:- start:229 stop:474 length:246 start_codon:yes stop_codon:yes gene_type:complete
MISIISLIVYVVVTDKLDENKDNIFKGNMIEKDKTKEYLIIVGIISISSFIVINMSSTKTELVPLKMSEIKEPLLNNKPPF